MPSESVSRASGGMKLRPYACEAVMWYSAILLQEVILCVLRGPNH